MEHPTDFHGIMRVQRVREGVKETVSLTTAHPPGTEPDLDAIPRAVAALASRGLLWTLSVSRRPDTRPEDWNRLRLLHRHLPQNGPEHHVPRLIRAPEPRYRTSVTSRKTP